MNIVFNKKDTTTEVDIFGDIGDTFFSEGNTLESVKAQFDKVDTPNLTINISSFGGLVSEGFAIHDLIKSFKGTTTAKIVGWTASMGTVIATAADKIEISENSHFLIHNAWTGIVGNARELREEATELDRIDNRLTAIYTNKTGLEDTEVRDLMAQEKWISPEEAQELGFVDSIIEPTKAAASVSNKELTKAGLPSIPETITNKIKEMEEATKVEETPAVEATTENSTLAEAFNSLKETIVNFTEKFATKPEEVKILDNDEVNAKLAEFETSIATATERQEEIDTLNAKVTDLESKLAAKEAGETVVEKTEEPAITEETKVNEWDTFTNNYLQRPALAHKLK